MTKKLTDAQKQAYAQDSLNLLQRTATKDVTFKANGKSYTIEGKKLTYGIVKKLTFKDEGEILGAFSQLWEQQIAKVAGAEDALDELDWDEAAELFTEWMSPINEAGEDMEKKYS